MPVNRDPLSIECPKCSAPKGTFCLEPSRQRSEMPDQHPNDRRCHPRRVYIIRDSISHGYESVEDFARDQFRSMIRGYLLNDEMRKIIIEEIKNYAGIPSYEGR